MNEDGLPIEAVEVDADRQEVAAIEPTQEQVKSLYEDLGIKASVPSGKAKGRPKAAAVRAKASDKDGAGDSADGKPADDDDKDKSKDAPAADADGDAGDGTDAKGAKDSKEAGKVQDEPKETDGGVRDDKPEGKKDSERGGEEDTNDGTGKSGEDEGKQDSAEEEGKRPGKSNPAVEQRFQKLTEESRAKDARIEELEQQIKENELKAREAEIAKEDPEYTVEDFKKVRDEYGEIHELDDDQAELAYRRWKDGFEQRKVEREAKFNREQSEEQRRQDEAEQLMRNSVAAYDELMGIYESTPQLDETSPEYDAEFSKIVMPLINDGVIYQEGTEPGNEAGVQPVIVGIRMKSSKVVDAIKSIREAKRTLPLNGTSDTVESRSNVNVNHSRSSDPTVKAANELYSHLGIDKRI